MPSSDPTGLFKDDTSAARCFWCAASLFYRHYHDTEWGFPVSDERRLFEKICLEGFQAGLSWLTILNKRENFRVAFANFDAINRLQNFSLIVPIGLAQSKVERVAMAINYEVALEAFDLVLA